MHAKSLCTHTQNGILAIELPKPKASYRIRLPDGDFLTFASFETKKDPNAEVIAVQLRRLEGDDWKTVEQITVYRAPDGTYSQIRSRKEKPE